jgi:hypothetical protein
MDGEMTDRWHADDSRQLRAVLSAAGVPPAAVDAYLEVLGERAALDAAMNEVPRRGTNSTGLARRRHAGMSGCPSVTLWGSADQTVGTLRRRELTAEHVTGPYRLSIEVPARRPDFLTDDAGRDQPPQLRSLDHVIGDRPGSTSSRAVRL